MKKILKSYITIFILFVMFITWLLTFYNIILSQLLISLSNPDIPFTPLPAFGVILNLILSFIMGINIGYKIKE